MLFCDGIRRPTPFSQDQLHVSGQTLEQPGISSVPEIAKGTIVQKNVDAASTRGVPFIRHFS